MPEALDQRHYSRHVLLKVCLIQSVVYGVPWQGLSLAVAFLAHNEFDMGSHWVIRNLCNSWGYASFNAGAIAIASAGTHLALEP